MKIAIVKKNFCGTGGGGAERYAAKICSELIKRGYDLKIYAEKISNVHADKNSFVQVSKTFLHGFSRTTNFHYAVQKKLRQDNHDIVYAISRTYPADILRVSDQIYAIWIKKILKRKFYFLNPRHLELLQLEKKIFNPVNTGIIIVNSLLVKRQLISEFNFPEEKIRHIRNGVDRTIFFPARSKNEICEIRKNLQLPEDKFILLFPACNFKIKGIDCIIKTLASLDIAIRNKILILAVGGDIDASGTKRMEKLGIGDLFRFDKRTERMRDYYVASDMLFFPSLYEPFANVCLEASACGLPILTTEMNGSSELVRHGSSGFVVPTAMDYKAISQAICDFIRLDAETRAKFAEES
ncbi:MAG: glycosyltransferase family 4 protein, partial [Candidatus Nanoarchaeia archaeon]